MSNDSLIRDWADAWNSHDVGRIRALFTDDAIYEDVPSGIRCEGDEVTDLFELNFVVWGPDFRVDDVSGFLTEHDGVIRWTMGGTRLGDLPGGIKAEGQHLSARGVSVFTLRDGRIHHNTDYWDGWLSLLRERGHIHP